MKLDADTWLAVQALMADYAAALDNGELQRWPDLFTTDAVYKLQSRENHERGLPLATMAFESQGMLRDRVYAAVDTLFHHPYYQRHIVSTPRLLGIDGGGMRFDTGYLVLRTHRDAMPEILSVGRYLDRIANSIIYPI
jgi:salicylate 5-hydroxylase small subunit